MELALAAARASDNPVLAVIAREYGVSRPALSRRFHGLSTSMHEKEENLRALNNHQEEALVRFIKEQSDRGLPLTPAMMAAVAAEMAGRSLSKNWASRFVQRHRDVLDSKYLNNLDLAHHQADSAEVYQQYFNVLEAKIKDYQILNYNTYNMDEKGFMVGILSYTRRVFAKRSGEPSEPPKAGQNGNQERVTVLATICGDGTALSPAVIYKADPGLVQDACTHAFRLDEHKCFSASSPNGFTSNELGFDWLVNIFDAETKSKARRQWRLLFVDGHGSHLNRTFMEKCHELKILLAFYPPHSTHRLQPLDVGCFGPLANYYSQGLNQMVMNSGGNSSIKKSIFFLLFSQAYEKAFVKKTIMSAWAKTGIWPFEPEIVLKLLRPRPVTPVPDQGPGDQSSPRPPTGMCTVSKPHKLRRFLAQASANADPISRKALRFLAHRYSKEIAKFEIMDVRFERERAARQQEEPQKRRQLNIGQQMRLEARTGALFGGREEVQLARDIDEQRTQEAQLQLEAKATGKEHLATNKANQEAEAQRKRAARAAAKAVKQTAAAEKQADSLATCAARQAQTETISASGSRLPMQKDKPILQKDSTTKRIGDGASQNPKGASDTKTRSGRVSRRPAFR